MLRATAVQRGIAPKRCLTIVPVLDLQEVADDAVRCHALRKVALSCLTPWSPLRPKGCQY